MNRPAALTSPIEDAVLQIHRLPEDRRPHLPPTEAREVGALDALYTALRQLTLAHIALVDVRNTWEEKRFVSRARDAIAQRYEIEIAEHLIY